METAIDFLIFLSQVAFWYFVTSVVLRLVFRKKDQELEEQREELIDKITKIIHRIKQEKHNDMYYWFDADTDRFLAQGRTDDEIRQHLLSRFKGHIFLINDDQAMAGPELKLMAISELTYKS